MCLVITMLGIFGSNIPKQEGEYKFMSIREYKWLCILYNRTDHEEVKAILHELKKGPQKLTIDSFAKNVAKEYGWLSKEIHNRMLARSWGMSISVSADVNKLLGPTIRIISHVYETMRVNIT